MTRRQFAAGMATTAEHYGIHRVEFQHNHFLSTEQDYLLELRNRVKKAKSMIHQINLEFSGLNVSATNGDLRIQAIDLTKRWIDIAAFIGCDYVMINQGTVTSETNPTAIDACKKIVAYGRAKKVGVSMENRGIGGAAADEVQRLRRQQARRRRQQARPLPLRGVAERSQCQLGNPSSS
jgi:sugar phosphate isomerase/epimerase